MSVAEKHCFYSLFQEKHVILCSVHMDSARLLVTIWKFPEEGNGFICEKQSQIFSFVFHLHLLCFCEENSVGFSILSVAQCNPPLPQLLLDCTGLGSAYPYFLRNSSFPQQTSKERFPTVTKQSTTWWTDLLFNIAKSNMI